MTRPTRRPQARILAAALLACSAGLALAQPAMPPMQIKPVRPGVYLITGKGGNATVLVGPDGVLLVDTKSPGQANFDELNAAIRSVTPLPVTEVLVTHHHGDHSGNIGRFAAEGLPVAGHVAMVEAVKTFPEQGGPPAPPTVTYADSLTVKSAGLVAEMRHFASAHTGDDSVVYVPALKLVIAGDEVDDDRPNIDFRGGGSIGGWLKALDGIANLDFDLLIPGHGGPPMTKAQFLTFRDKARTFAERGRAAVAAGVPKDQLLASIRTDDLGWPLNIPTWTAPERVDALYAELARGPVVPARFDFDPVLVERPAKPVSAHVWALEGMPNVAIVVGERATLVVDTGLGPRNGALVAREARRLSNKGQKLYLTTTHFHPEHTAGDAGFPAGTVLIRPRVQQAELEADGPGLTAFFAGRSPVQKQLLDGVAIRKADVLFDRDYRLDLGGGVVVRLMWRGPAHTRGDEIVFVDPDRTLIPGDVVQDRIVPNALCAECTPKSWIAVIDQIAPLKPLHIVPDHGNLGGPELIGQERAFLAELETGAAALKAQGKPAEETGRVIGETFKAEHGDWLQLQNVPAQAAKAWGDPPAK
jgi:glyoxylase-like metal-dependent hydrolase (beta-lactamase superfamily II)